MKDDRVPEQVASYIDHHINEELTLDKIADALNYSKFYMARSFAERTGCTIYKYIQGRRLTLAAKKLVETREPIIEIAYEAHYNSQQAFTLAFSRLYQCTPQVYRKKGVFYPMQTEITLRAGKCLSGTGFERGGMMAA